MPARLGGTIDVCVLLVEDDYLIRLIMSESLSDAGFDVIEAASGDQAIELIRNPPRPITVLVTDFHMPGGQDGSHVAASIRQRWPSLPVVIASGRPDVFQASWKNEFGYTLLNKPYTPRALVDLVQMLVDVSAGRQDG